MVPITRTHARNLSIDYEAENFPVGRAINGSGSLSVTWDDIVWSALTIGRPNIHHVFQHGASSVYEAIFRISLVRMALEQSSPRARILRRTAAFKGLDPTEKGAVNYFLGMTICKLFAAKKMNTPWLLHLDLFKSQVGLTSLGRSRPDLIGEETSTGQWHAFESKGRASVPDKKEKQKAKDQARRVLSVNSANASLHVGAIAYFRGDTLCFYWCDPPVEGSDDDRGIEIEVSEEHWGAYYGPIAALFARWGDTSDDRAAVALEELDLTVKVHPKLVHTLQDRQWRKARALANELSSQFANEGYREDGVKVECGLTWSLPLQPR